MNEAARGLLGVAEQALPQRERIDNQRQSVNERVPAARLAIFDGVQVTLDSPLVTQWAEHLQLRLADAVAGGCEILQRRLAGKLLIECDEFAAVPARSVRVSVADGWQFARQENLFVVAPEKVAQRRQACDRSRRQRAGQCVQRHEAIRRAELLNERVRVAQPFGCVLRQFRFRPRIHFRFCPQLLCRGYARIYFPHVGFCER